MATRFVRVDLSEEARDFRPIAIEPGVPMLDRNGANARIMFRWLGGMVAEPVWDGEAVGFYVRDDQGGRLEDVVCQPASSQDIASLLKDDMSKLCQRLEQSKAETGTERTLRKVVMRTFEELTKNPNRSDLDSYFFRYRDVLGNWRLIWCWGYQRQDFEPAPSVVCTNPDCKLLFLRRPGKSPRCPACAGELSLRTGNETNWKVAGLAALALLLLLLGVGWWATRPARLVATPATFTGPVGSSAEPKIVERRLFGSRDITRETIGISDDPRVVKFDPITGEIRLVGAGTTKVEFHRGEMKAEMAVAVTASANPEKLVIEPDAVAVAIGTTARLRCYGDFKDKTHVDLTNSVVWVPKNDGKAFAAGGLVEGLAPGTTTVTARFRATPESPNVEAAATVNVGKVDFKSLEVAVDPTTITAGRGGKLRIDAIAPDGKHYSLLESSQLKTALVPDDLADVTGSNIRGKRAGEGKLSASLANTQLTGQGNVKVVAPATFVAEVRPKSLDLVVDEIADIGVISPDTGAVTMTSSKPGVVDITSSNRVIGRAAGETEIDVQQGGRSIGKVPVTVAQADLQTPYFDPDYLTVAVDDSLKPRVLAEIKGSQPPRMAEISPDRLTVKTDKLSARYAEFNNKFFELRGISATDDPSKPQMLTVDFHGIPSKPAPVEVYLAPCRLELEPAGTVELPMGQLVRLQPFATYSGGRRTQLRPEVVVWATEEAKAKKKVDGLELFYRDKDFPDLVGAVGATKAGAGPLTVYASYHSQDSNRVAIKSVDADPTVKLALETDSTTRTVGDEGQAVLKATSANGAVELTPRLIKFSSSNENILKIREKTGLFGSVSAGDAVVTAQHATVKDAATLKFHVNDEVEPKPDKLMIVSDQGPLVHFPAGATFDDFRVEAHYADGYTHLVTKKAKLSIPEPPTSACLSAAGGKLVGVRKGSTAVSAEFDGIHTTAPLKAEVLGEVDIDKLVIDPNPIVARPGETFELKAIGFKDGKSIGDITGLGSLTWKSSKPDVARVTGPSVSAASLGAADITVERGAIKGTAAVNVTNSIEGELRVDPKLIVMHVGESLRLGSDINVYRGEMNVGENASVVPESPGVVVYIPETKALVAKNEGSVPVGIAVGDKIVRIEVKVVPQSVEVDGTLSIEPASIILAPGQAERVRVYLDTKDGQHIDRTASAVIKALPATIATIDDRLARVCAVSAGKAKIYAAVGNLPSAVASLEVVDDELTEISADPADVQIAVGGDGPVIIYGRAKTTGLKELFPQDDLKVVPNKTGIIEMLGADVVRGTSEGEDALAISFKNKLKTSLAVKVLPNSATGLQIDPPVKTIDTNEGITYEVSVLRNGHREIVTASGGVKLQVVDENVAQVANDLTVISKGLGTTRVRATFGGEQAEATLNVVPGGAIKGVPGVGVIQGGSTIYRDDGVNKIVIGDDPMAVAPAGNPVGLVFRPDVYMAGVQAQPETAKVLLQFSNGGFKDVTADPSLQLTQPGEQIAKMEKTDGGLKISPVGPGLTTLSGSYNGQVAKMRIEINGGLGGPLAGRLIVPEAIRLASGESQPITDVEIDPGGGMAHVPVEVKVSATAGQGIVSVDDRNNVVGKAPGQSRVMVVPVDPRYAALATSINVDVTAAEKISIDPNDVILQVGQTVAPAVKSKSASGEEIAVAGAKIESSDKNVVDVDPDNPTQFKAVGQGQAELKATYRGQGVTAKVSVSSDRFKSVEPTLNEIAGNKDQFDLTIEALAAKDEGELEYRVYSADDANPKENWVPNQDSGDGRKVTLRSDPINYGPRGTTYHLVLEARDKSKKSVQKYPLPFIIGSVFKSAQGGGAKPQEAPPEKK